MLNALSFQWPPKAKQEKKPWKNIKEAIEGYLEVKAELIRSKVKGEKAEVVVEAPSTLLA